MVLVAKAKALYIRNNRGKLSGRVEVDDFFIDSKKPGNHGRGDEAKTIVLVAMESDTVQDPDTLNS